METTTRSGRVSKPPKRYEPVEIPVDDYATDDYDTELNEDVESDDDDDDDEELSDDDSDADEDGNLDGFVVPDKSESDDEDSEDDGQPPVISVVKKRPVSGKS
jgi:hypothetical protein